MLGRVIRDLFRKPSKEADAVQTKNLIEEAPVYTPEVFAVPDLERAKTIILTPEHGLTTEERWETETHYLCGAIGDAFNLGNGSLVLDYGCGIGRISKALIERYGCKVIGVDISNSMRQLALGYAASDSFSAVSPEILKKLVANGLRVDFGIAIWVLQHCHAVSDDIALIKASLKENGLLFVLNTEVSAIPTSKGWMNDGVDIRELLQKEFTMLNHFRLPTSATSRVVSEHSFVAQLRNDKLRPGDR